MDAVMGPDKPPETFRGTDSVRSIGGLWVLCEGRPGGGTGRRLRAGEGRDRQGREHGSDEQSCRHGFNSDPRPHRGRRAS